MNSLSKDAATWHEIGESAENQRIDNFLRRTLKGVPSSHVYRILRSGEVRVNSRRVDQTYRLKTGDRVRIPPVSTTASPSRKNAGPVRPILAGSVLFEDSHLLVLNKPSGMAVHGGSGISFGVVEQLRRERPQAPVLELVHRLDRETSGILLVAKKRAALTGLHEQIRAGSVRKWYLALVQGRWRGCTKHVRLALEKYVLASGERRVSVKPDGQTAHTVVRPIRSDGDFTLIEAELKTGRTHQIRVHLAHLGFPIAGDDKYGDFAYNKTLIPRGLSRMFLHARCIEFVHPATGEPVHLEAPLPKELERFLAAIADSETGRDE